MWKRMEGSVASSPPAAIRLLSCTGGGTCARGAASGPGSLLATAGWMSRRAWSPRAWHPPMRTQNMIPTPSTASLLPPQ